MRREKASWAVFPLTAWLGFFLLLPLLGVVVVSFLSRGRYGGIEFEPTLANYARAFDAIYIEVLWNSAKLAGLTALLCACLGYPLATWLVSLGARARAWALFAVMLPFWTNVVVRAYAVKSLVGSGGWLEALFGHGSLAVVFGMVSSYLPFMVLPLLVRLDRLDPAWVEAARDLGASRFQVFRRVTLPLTRRALATGFLLVFAPALGEFVIPSMFGGAKTVLVGSVVTEQFLRSRDWPFGAALAFVLLVPVSLLFLLQKDEKVHAN